MLKSRMLLIIVATGILLCLGLIGTFAVGGWSSSASATFTSGRSIKTTANTLWLEVGFAADTATIKTLGNVVVVAPNAIYLNERYWAPLDPAAKDVQVTMQQGQLRIVADGNVIQPRSASSP